MCTKAVSVNVRAMSDRLKVPFVPPTVSSAMITGDNGNGDTLPTDYSPVITMNRPREIQFMRWGLVPHFAADLKGGAPMFNARAETLLQLPSFRDLVTTSRCLILNEGFYERETQGNERVEWKITPSSEDYFYKAGLWTTWNNRDTGEAVESFTMITCDPGQSAIGKLHDRMPIIVNKEERRLWMNPKASQAQVVGLFKPCSDEMFVITESGRKPFKGKRPPNRDNLELL